MGVTVVVDVQIASDVVSVPSESEIHSWLSHTVSSVCKEEAAEFELAVRVVDEPEGRDLNRQFRDQDRATNVLSFPVIDDPSMNIPDADARALGDIVICGPLVEREAAEQHKDPASHWGHLLVHGALHLLGYDHETEAEAVQMENLERELLAARGIDDPYSVA